MVVPIGQGPSLRFGRPRLLVAVPGLATTRFRRYDVAPDGRRFAIVRKASGPREAGELRVVLGWEDEVRAGLADQ